MGPSAVWTFGHAEWDTILAEELAEFVGSGTIVASAIYSGRIWKVSPKGLEGFAWGVVHRDWLARGTVEEPIVVDVASLGGLRAAWT